MSCRDRRGGFGRDPGEDLGTRPRVEDDARLDPRAPRLHDPPARVVEFARVVGIGIDRQDATGLDGPAGTLDGQVQAVR